ncbi:Uncharacterized protein Fot_15679 [Forsythia ovata]|uniref:Uncharacterized protein n=1 Tax=Forsythia ovata TaxID=205694 RepID=A0ABD1W9U2_9LAMI
MAATNLSEPNASDPKREKTPFTSSKSSLSHKQPVVTGKSGLSPEIRLKHLPVSIIQELGRRWRRRDGSPVSGFTKWAYLPVENGRTDRAQRGGVQGSNSEILNLCHVASESYQIFNSQGLSISSPSWLLGGPSCDLPLPPKTYDKVNGSPQS